MNDCKYPEECAKAGRCIGPGDHDKPRSCRLTPQRVLNFVRAHCPWKPGSRGAREFDLALDDLMKADRPLTAPAMVGNTSFGIGVAERMVIARAQREYGYRVTPEKEQGRIARARAAIARFFIRADVTFMREALIELEQASLRMAQCWNKSDARGEGVTVAEMNAARQGVDAARRKALSAIASHWEAKYSRPVSAFEGMAERMAERADVRAPCFADWMESKFGDDWTERQFTAPNMSESFMAGVRRVSRDS